MSAHNAYGVIIVDGREMGRYTDLCTSALDNVGKHLGAKPLSVSEALSVTLSVDTYDWQKPLADFCCQHGWHDIPMKYRRKVGPRRCRTVWVRPSFTSDVDSCLFTRSEPPSTA